MYVKKGVSNTLKNASFYKQSYFCAPCHHGWENCLLKIMKTNKINNKAIMTTNKTSRANGVDLKDIRVGAIHLYTVQKRDYFLSYGKRKY